LEERRRFPRIKFKTGLRYQVRGQPRFDTTVCDNISAGGIGFIADQFIAPERVLMLEVNLLSRVLHPIGQIISSLPLPHSNKNRIGVKFLEFDADEKNYLQDYINMQIGQF
jgi:c-di-GMP-binding flagellar brake protein YcgR